MGIERLMQLLQDQGLEMLQRHLFLVFVSLFFAILLALPIGILVTRPPFNRKINQILSFLNTAQGVPSLAVVAIFLPIMGIGVRPALFALTIYALLPIARNTVAAINALDPDVLESAKGMGLSKKEVLWKVELPLASPIIMAGIQTAAIFTVGTATIAHVIGAGGFGRLIFTGIAMTSPEFVLAGSLATAIMAITLDFILGYFQSRVQKKFGE
jgi:osmoprotectant transport system permease protein